MERLTYKSSMGDYGNDVEFNDDWDEKCAYRNALGKYEDLGLTPEEIQKIIDAFNKVPLQNIVGLEEVAKILETVN